MCCKTLTFLRKSKVSASADLQCANPYETCRSFIILLPLGAKHTIIIENLLGLQGFRVELPASCNHLKTFVQLHFTRLRLRRNTFPQIHSNPIKLVHFKCQNVIFVELTQISSQNHTKP